MRTTFVMLVLVLPVIGCGSADPLEDEGIPAHEAHACGALEDDFANGSTDTRWSYFYTADGFPDADEGDRNLDGTIDEVLDYDTDDDGNVIARTWDVGNDGTPEQRDDWEYDRDGNETLHEIDYGADGAIEYRRRSIYEDGRLVTIELDGVVGDADGVVDDRWTHHHDDRDRIDTVDEDRGADGTVDAVQTHFYDSAGEMARVEVARTDGTLERAWTFDHDEAGRATGWQFDGDADGDADFSVAWTYDDDDRMTGFTMDVDGDGSPDDEMSFLYECDWRAAARVTAPAR